MKWTLLTVIGRIEGGESSSGATQKGNAESLGAFLYNIEMDGMWDLLHPPDSWWTHAMRCEENFQSILRPRRSTFSLLINLVQLMRRSTHSTLILHLPTYTIVKIDV